MAKRYDQKKKDEVVEFIQSYNAKNGRGGQSAAAKKFSINPITVKSWLVAAGGGAKPEKKSATRKQTRKTAKTPSGSLATLQRMTKIQEEITALQGQISTLQREYDSLKKTL